MAEHKDFNLDLISKEPGAHPVGTGLGAVAGGAVAGAAAGALGGPIGAALGVVIGAVAGGMSGRAAAEAFNPTAEEAYWESNYHKEPYYQEGRVYEDYAPAYQMGMHGRTQFGENYADAERDMSQNWDAHRQNSILTWPEVSAASRAAWDRVDMPTQGATRPTATVGRTVSAGNDTTPMRGSTTRTFATVVATGDGATVDGVMETSDVIDTLNDLLECCRDGEYGFRQCAENAKDSEVQMILTRRAVDCQAGSVELKELILQHGGDIDDGGTSSGALHHGWVSLKGMLSGYSTQAMLDECERGEDSALARYRKALKQNLPEAVRSTIARQAEVVLRNHDQIKTLRDSYKEAR